MAYSKRMKMEAYRTLAFGAIGAAFAAVGTGLLSPARLFILTNLTDQAVIISLDGVTNHFYLAAGGFKLIDVSTNRVQDYAYFLAEGTVFYAKHAGVAPASGLITIETIVE